MWLVGEDPARLTSSVPRPRFSNASSSHWLVRRAPDALACPEPQLKKTDRCHLLPEKEPSADSFKLKSEETSPPRLPACLSCVFSLVCACPGRQAIVLVAFWFLISTPVSVV